MANVKISDLTPTTTLQSTDLLIISSDNGAGYDTRSITASMLESAGKKKFICTLSQAGTSAPNIINTYQDDFNDTYTTNYVSVGSYELIGFNSELNDDCELEITANVLSAIHTVELIYTAADTLLIRTYDSSFTLVDNVLSSNNIFIKVTKHI